MRNYDLQFLKRFSIVIAFLAVITVGLIILAVFLQRSIPSEPSALAAQRVEQRIAPAGAVYAGSTGAAAAAAAAEAAAARAAAAGGAYGGTLDGQVIFDKLCTACHLTGVGNAPTLARGDWNARIAQGTETLYKHAIEGYTGPDGGVMPPKGGNAALSEEQMHAAVDWMLANLK